jgi:hypothetical protein
MDTGRNIFCPMGSGACGRLCDWNVDLVVLRDLGDIADRANRERTRAR